MVATGLRGRWLTAPLLPSAATMFTLPPIQRLGEGDDSAEPGTAGPSPSPSRSSMLSKKSPKKARRRLRLKMGSRVRISDPDPDVDGTVCCHPEYRSLRCLTRGTCSEQQGERSRMATKSTDSPSLCICSSVLLRRRWARSWALGTRRLGQ